MYLPNGLIIVVDPAAGETTTTFPGVTDEAHVQLDAASALPAASSARDAAVAARLRAGLATVTYATSWANARGLAHLADRFSVPLSVVSQTPIDGVRVVHPDSVRGVLADTRFVHEVDVIGDVHGQLDLLERMLGRLGHTGLGTDDYEGNGRLAVFTGDAINKGPHSLEVLTLLREAVSRGQALVLKGNNEHWLEKRLGEIAQHASTGDAWVAALRALAEKSPPRRRSILRALARSDERNDGFTALRAFFAQLPMFARFAGGDLWAVHASVPRGAVDLDEISPAQMRKWAVQFMYGPVGRNGHRPDWVAHYKGENYVVRGHVTVPAPEIRNRVISLDTGAGDGDDEGAALSALRWPELEFETVTRLELKQ